jgi:hypothetical protein
MPLTIRDAESAYLLGATAYARWEKAFKGQFMAPLGVALLGMTLAELKRNPQKVAGVNPEALERVVGMFKSLTGQPNPPAPTAAPRWRKGGTNGN